MATPSGGGKVVIKGLRELQRTLKATEAGLPIALRRGLKSVAEAVAEQARPTVPVLTGRARGSIRAYITARGAGVRAGGSRAPYFGWLEFGGRLPSGAVRARIEEGRYLGPAVVQQQAESGEKVERMLEALFDLAGWDHPYQDHSVSDLLT